MAGGYQHQPEGVAALVAMLREQQHQINNLRKSITGLGIQIDGDTGNLIFDLDTANGIVVSSPEGITVENGGGATIKDGGTVEVDDVDGNVIASIGTDPINPAAHGFIVRRTDGSVMIEAVPVGYVGLPYTAIRDALSNAIVWDNPVAGGIQSPYLSMGQWVDYAAPGAAATPTTSATFVPIQICQAYRQHARFVVSAIVTSSSAGTTGEIQVFDGFGTAMATPLAVPANATSFVMLGPTTWPSWGWQDFGSFTLQARRTGGTGTIGVRGYGFVGLGS